MKKKDVIKHLIKNSNVNIFLFLKFHCLYNFIIFLMIFILFFLVKISKTYLNIKQASLKIQCITFLRFSEIY